MADGPGMLSGRALHVVYPGRGGVLGRRGTPTVALDGVDLDLHEGEILALVGRSGAGKSTLARVLAALERPDQGEVTYGGKALDAMDAAERRTFRRAVQVVFQDPVASLDPRLRVEAAIAEPLHIHKLVARRAVRDEVARLLAAVGLPGDDEFMHRFPHELSGGERQRVAVARALAVRPRILLLDEPVASLDVSVRGQVMNQLLALRDRFGLTMLLIAHDLRLVGACSERVAVMLRGRIVEDGPTRAILRRPEHPHTLALAEAGAADRPASRSNDSGGYALPGGCRYRAVCPRAAEACRIEPFLQPLAGAPERRVACWFPSSGETLESKVS